MLQDHFFENGTAESVLPLVFAMASETDGYERLAECLWSWSRPDVRATEVERSECGLRATVWRARHERRIELCRGEGRWTVRVDGVRAASFRLDGFVPPARARSRSALDSAA